MTLRSPVILLIVLLIGWRPLPAIATEHYQIDTEHTAAIFEYRGLAAHQGIFERSSGSIDIDTEHHTGSIAITIAADSINTGSATFNRILRSAAFFDAALYPTIQFTSNQLQFSNDELRQISGDLRIRGITRTVVLDITRLECPANNEDSSCHAEGVAKILRSDFKVGRFIPFVSDEVRLYLNVVATKK